MFISAERLPGFSHRDRWEQYPLRERAIRKRKGLPDTPRPRAAHDREEIKRRRTARGTAYSVLRAALVMACGSLCGAIVARMLGL